jgi:hypothetical protein
VDESSGDHVADDNRSHPFATLFVEVTQVWFEPLILHNIKTFTAGSASDNVLIQSLLSSDEVNSGVWHKYKEASFPCKSNRMRAVTFMACQKQWGVNEGACDENR